MIISLKYNYIYIRTRKTGSSTIESVLYDTLGPEDIYVREDISVIAPVAKPGVALQNDFFVTHIAAADIRPLIRDDIWNGFFKFTSERHPYEKAVSYAYFRNSKTVRRRRRDPAQRGRRDGKDFAAHLDRVVNRGNYASAPYYMIDGRPVVDDFIRLETLDADLRRIGTRLGIAIPDALPRKRVTERDDPRPAREILSPQQRDKVYEHCEAEFALLGYER
jgi:hypothetical protein